MNTFLRRILASAAALLALAAAPAAWATAPASVALTTPSAGSLGLVTGAVTLSASASASGGGATVTQIDFRVNGSSVGIATTSPFSVQWTPSVPGTYTLTAIATDSTASPNTLTSAPVVVAISAVHSAAVVQPVANTTITQGSDVLIRASTTMSDGIVDSVQFLLKDSSLVETSLGSPVTSAPYHLVQNFASGSIPVGNYNLIARVSGGGTTWDSTSSFPVSVVAQVGSAGPVVSLVTPTITDVISVGNAVTVTATATDADGFIPSTAPGGVSFYADGELIATDLTAPYSVSWTPTVAKSVTLVAIAVDDKGNSRASSRTITVLPVAPTVAVSAPSNNSSATVGTAVTVTATATAGAGTTISSVQFLADGTPIGSPDTTAPFSVSWTPAASGTVVLTARVTDSNLTVVNSAPVNVNVAAAPGALSVALSAPANGASVPLGTTATVTATASAAGSATVNRVDFLAGSTVIGTALSAPYTISWTPSAAGVTSLTARVTDSAGATATSPIVNVNVTAPSVALTAPTSGTAVVLGLSTTLSATASAVSPATVTKVEFFAGTTLLSSVSSAPYTYAWTPGSTGSYSLTARVTDSNGGVVISSAVSVSVASSVPTVALTSPANGAAIPLGGSATLTATAAAGSGATVNRVDFLAGSTVVGTALSAPYTVTWSPSASGVTALTARVTDSNATVVNSPVVNVTVTAPSVSLATSLTPGATAPVGSPVTLTATPTAVSPATVSRVEFYVGALLVGSATSAPYTYSWTPVSSGSYSLTAKVVDSNGAIVTSSAVSVTAATGSGTAVLTSPSAGASIPLGTSVSLTGTASAVFGQSVSRVDFYAGSTLVATSLTDPYSAAWTPTVAGVASLTARATDTAGSVVTSAPVLVNVTAPSVALTAPLAGSAIVLGSSATLTASASAVSPATLTKVEFFAGTTLLASVTSAPYSYSWTPTSAGSYSLTARATDSNGGVITSTAVSVTVATSVPTIALTAPANGASVALGGSSTLTATATAGGGATVSRVDFLAGSTVIGTALTAPYSVSWAPSASGVTALTARVTDSNGTAVTSAVVNVNVTAPSVALTAPLAGSAIVLGSSATLTASASAVSPATLTKVEFFAGTTLLASVTSAPYSYSWTPTSAGSYSLTARATDSNGGVVTSTAVSVTVATSVPTIALTAPVNAATIPLGTSSTLTALATAGSGATVSRVDFLAGTTLLGTVLSAPYTFNWTPSASGVAALSAKVTDSNGTAVTSAIVNVNVTAPTISLATNLSPGASGSVGSTISLTAIPAANSPATVSRVDFYAGAVLLGSANSAPYTYDWVPSAGGSYSLTAKVVDSNGAIVTSTAVSVTVTGSSSTVALTSPTSGSSLSIGSATTLSATATAGYGQSVSRVDFFAGNTLIGTAIAPPYSVSWTPGAVGVISLTARVTDSANAVVTSAPVLASVAASGPNLAVALTSPTQGTSLTAGVPTGIVASVTAADIANIVRVDFYVGSATGTPIGSSITPSGSQFSTTWTPVNPGTFTLVARVTDAGGATATSPLVAVTVAAGGGTGNPVTASMNINGPASIPAGSTRVITASAGGGTGYYDRAELYLGNTLVATDTAAPFSFLFTAPTGVGTYNLSVRVFDSLGLWGGSAVTPLYVVPPIGVAPAAAIVTPASGSFLGVGAAAVITGTATDADGTISSVQVYVNGSYLGNANLSGSTWSIPWTPSAGGAASLTAIAVDNSGNAIVAPSVGVTIADSSSPNIALTFSPGPAQPSVATLPTGATRNIVASVSPATGRAIVRVEFFVDGTKVGEDTTAPYTFRYVAPELPAGEQSRSYVFSARATDNAGAARDTIQPILVVTPVGQGPTINLITPANGASVVPNVPVSLASAAVASGGTITSVQYYVNGSPAFVNGGNPINNAPYTSTFVPTTAGTYVIDAIATDDRGNTKVSNSATITASFANPTVSITSPNPNAVARATPNVPLNIAATATVPSGTGAAILLVEFLLDGIQIGADTTAPYSFSWTPTVAQLGAHVLTARVTDTNSQTATSAPVNVNVANLVGTPPTITISTSPIPGQGLQTLSQVNFVANAAASAPGATITSVEFFLNDQSIGTASREQATNLYRVAYDFSRFDISTAPQVTDPNTGVTRYTPIPVYAIARDSNNNQTVSTTSNLTLNPSTSSPPSLQLIALSQNSIAQGQQFFMIPAFSDPDGTVTQIQLYANGVLVSAVGSPQPGQILTYNANTAGRFNLYAVALDDTGNSVISTPSIVVNVNALNPPTTTIVQPANDATVTTINAPVFLEGTADASGTTQIPTLQFIITSSSGNRSTINGNRVGTTSTYRAIWTPTTPDTYSISTQANLGNTASGTSTASRRVVVNNVVGIAPTVSISVPGSVTTASSSNFTANASDSDGSIIDVEFFLNRQSIGFASRDQLATTWRLRASYASIQPGTYEVVARARDDSGNVVASGTSFINISASSSLAPTITVTPSTTDAAYNRQVQLTASALDSDGTITNVQYFVNNSSLGSSGTASTSYLVNWTPTTSGIFSLYAIATDNTGNTSVSAPVEVTVRRNNPIQENTAFVLQTYQDIANTTSINPLVFSDLDAQLTAGTLSRADLVARLVTESGFTAPVNTLAAYYLLMGQWPTPSNYSSVLSTTRNSGLSAAIGFAGQGQGTILGSNEYFAKYGIVPTTQLLDSPTGLLPAEVFLNRLHQSAGLPPPEALDRVRFRSNNVLSATQGRGYAVVGLQSALAEFVTNTNSANTAMFDRARAAALFYQLTRPTASVTTDEIATRVSALLTLGTNAVRGLPIGTDRTAAFVRAVADSVLRDTLYSYRYVTITRHPQSLTVNQRSGAIFSVEASGAPPLAYQWLLNGAPIAGATTSLLSLTNVDATRVGTYTVTVTSSAASATSDPASLKLSTTQSRLANISTRGVTSSGSNVLIGGFVVTGANVTQTRQMLIRVIGPTLGRAPFNVSGVLANPRLEVFTGSNPNPILVNDDWGNQTGGQAQVTAIQQAAARVGAFALPSTSSEDAVVLATLPPGLYTVQASAAPNSANASGVVLIEVYDVTAAGTAGPKASNVSTRGTVGTGNDILIAGFVVNGTASRRMLIRGAGPTLSRLNVPGVLADPQLKLIDQGTGAVIRTNDDWSTGLDAGVIASAATAAGAFPFASGSKDAAMIVMLPPGAYTVQLSGVNNGTGVGIVEVYDVDP